MADAEITAAAQRDVDNLPLTADELARLGAAATVRAVRALLAYLAVIDHELDAVRRVSG